MVGMLHWSSLVLPTAIGVFSVPSLAQSFPELKLLPSSLTFSTASPKPFQVESFPISLAFSTARALASPPALPFQRVCSLFVAREST